MKLKKLPTFTLKSIKKYEPCVEAYEYFLDMYGPDKELTILDILYHRLYENHPNDAFASDAYWILVFVHGYTRIRTSADPRLRGTFGLRGCDYIYLELLYQGYDV